MVAGLALAPTLSSGRKATQHEARHEASLDASAHGAGSAAPEVLGGDEPGGSRQFVWPRALLSRSLSVNQSSVGSGMAPS